MSTADIWAKCDLVKTLLTLPGKPAPKQVAQVFDHLLDCLTRNTDVFYKQALAEALASVADKLTPDQAGKAFNDVVSALARSKDLENRRAFFKILAAPTGKPIQEQAASAIDQFVSTFATANDAWARRALAKTVAATPGKLGEDHLQLLFDILKWPSSVAETRSVVLKRLERESGKDFRGDLSAAARWGRALGLDVTTAPRRQLLQLTRNNSSP